MSSPHAFFRLALSLSILTACAPSLSDDGSTDSDGDSDGGTSSSSTTNPASSSTSPTATVSSGTDSTTSTGTTTVSPPTGTEDTSTTAPPIVDDFGSPGDVGRPGCEEEECLCSSVDILFVVDNSLSMESIQDTLSTAAEPFLQALSDTLAPGTNVHLGVTTTGMGFSSSGSSMLGDNCEFTGDGGQPNDAFYETPDVSDNGRNGAQGRLYDPGSGEYFASFDSGDDPSAAITWLQSAVTVGTDGSNIEMSTAPVGWAFDPANAATNDGFLRDDGSVLAVFFVGDEPDQTPGMIDSSPAATWALERVANAKENCGGLDCVIAGGLLRNDVCRDDGLPLAGFLDGVGERQLVETLPQGAIDIPALSEQVDALLSGGLVDAIAQRCEALLAP